MTTVIQTKLKGHLLVAFGVELFDAFDQEEQQHLLDAMLNFGAECYISYNYYEVLRRQIRADYPHLSDALAWDTPLEILAFVLFDECFTERSFEEALKSVAIYAANVDESRLVEHTPIAEPNTANGKPRPVVRYSLAGLKAKHLTDPAEIDVCRQFYQAGIHYAKQFKAEYKQHFEQALAEQPFAPQYAFLMACDNAGLPIDEWAALWPNHLFDALNYSYEAEEESEELVDTALQVSSYPPIPCDDIAKVA